LAIGILLALPAERLIRSFLYNVHPLDAWTYAAVLLALPIIGLIAALVPALQSRVDSTHAGAEGVGHWPKPYASPLGLQTPVLFCSF